MKTRFKNDRGFPPLLFGIIYTMLVIGLLIFFIIPLIVLLVYNSIASPLKIAEQTPAADTEREPIPYFKITTPMRYITQQHSSSRPQ